MYFCKYHFFLRFTDKKNTVILMRKYFFVLFFILPVHKSFLQNSASVAEIEKLISVSADYLVKTQYNSSTDAHFKGEWHSLMGLSQPVLFFGPRKDYEDSNSFMLSSTLNLLSELYLSDTLQYKHLLPAIDRAFVALEPFRNGQTYNFWHAFPRVNKKRKEEISWLRGPSTYPFQSEFFVKVANMFDDADDTAAAFTAAYYQSKIYRKQIVPLLSPHVDSFTDRNRQNYNWYNWIYGIPRNTGAFLTYFGPEYRHRHPGMFQILLHSTFFLAPKSAAYPHFGKSYMPYGTNDVDLIVNLNVLSYLALSGELKSNTNAINAIRYVRNCLGMRHPKNAIIYYANDYQLPFALVQAYSKGVDQLRPAVMNYVAEIKAQQHADGSFHSGKKINHRDVVQSTANALYAMLFAGNFEALKTGKSIESAVQFLVRNKMVSSKDGICWKGGVFFSGGSVIKNYLFFKSDAYTTALIARTLQYYCELKKRGDL